MDIHESLVRRAMETLRKGQNDEDVVVNRVLDRMYGRGRRPTSWRMPGMREMETEPLRLAFRRITARG